MFDGGFSATSLAVFTALAPAGAVAFACLAAFLLVNRSQSRDWRDMLAHLLFIPLAIAWVGFIASATHLGTPANALHAINGLGRSPLSNEVVSAVAFLFFAGMAWMYSYREKPKASVMNGLLAISIVCVIVMLFHTSFAYSIATVPTWDTWLTPVRAGKWPYALLLIAVAALAAGTVLLVCHMNFLGTVGNNVTLASALVPNYGWLIAAHAALAICGLAFQLHGLRLATSRTRGLVFSVIGCAVVVIAALLARFPFYDAYLSVGF